MRTSLRLVAVTIVALPLNTRCCGQQGLSAKRLQELLHRFPAADTNGDGKLSRDEAIAYRNKLSAQRAKRPAKGRAKAPGIKRQFKVDPGWDLKRFPEHAVCYKSPADIKALYARVMSGKGLAVVSYPKPADGALRIVGIGHSFMMRVTERCR